MSAFSPTLNVLVNQIAKVFSMIRNASIPAWFKGFLNGPVKNPIVGTSVESHEQRDFCTWLRLAS